jgi:molecular chaperone GrpE
MPELPPTPAEDQQNLPAQNGQAEAEAKNDGLLQRAELAERQRDDYYRMLKQTQADYENAHQRNRREREQERLYMAGSLAKDLLPALDNLERAMKAAQDAKETGALTQGVGLVHSQILDALKRHGIKPMEADGKQFDPNLHHAVMQVPAADQPPNTIVQVLEQGYLIHDRVLRPASVVIAKGPSQSPRSS